MYIFIPEEYIYSKEIKFIKQCLQFMAMSPQLLQSLVQMNMSDTDN